MADAFALIPCDICGDVFPLTEYEKHEQTHRVQVTGYNSGNMYGGSVPVGPEQGGYGPLPAAPSNHSTQAPSTAVSVTATDYDMGDMYGHQNKNTRSIIATSLDDEKKIEIQELTEAASNALRDDGCWVISNGFRESISRAALRTINHALRNGPKCLSSDEYQHNSDILDLFNESAAFSLAQNVLGMSNVVIPKTAEIILLFPEKQKSIEDKDKKEQQQNEPRNQNVTWRLIMDDIDCSLAMRMILSDQTFVFYRGSHVTLSQRIKSVGMDAFMQQNKNEKERKPLEDKNVVVEHQVYKGDIVLLDPFLCAPMDTNSDTENIHYSVQFKVNRK